MRRRHMSGYKRGGSGRALTNERKYPFIVELAVTGEELELALSRRIIVFHRGRHIQTRHGRTILRNGETHYRWCFPDLATARAFLEQSPAGAAIEGPHHATLRQNWETTMEIQLTEGWILGASPTVTKQ